MSATNYDSRTADKFVVRLPDGLRADIEAAAHASDRSMNSVFVQAVRQYLDGQKRQQILLDVLANTVTTLSQGGVFGLKNGSVITGASIAAEYLHIDDRVRMAANAKRYEWLRDVAFDTPRQDLVPRDKSGNMLIKQDLDSEIDLAMKAHPSEQEDEPCED